MTSTHKIMHWMFTEVALFILAKNWNQPKFHHWRVGKPSVVYPNMEILFNHNKNTHCFELQCIWALKHNAEYKQTQSHSTCGLMYTALSTHDDTALTLKGIEDSWSQSQSWVAMALNLGYSKFQVPTQKQSHHSVVSLYRTKKVINQGKFKMHWWCLHSRCGGTWESRA